MAQQPHAHSLSRRERQIMDVLHRRERATAAEVQADLPAPPSYSSVRALLRILEQKGHVRHFDDGPRYVFEPVAPKSAERKSALRHVVKTFFDGSIAETVQALIDTSESKLTKAELDELARRIAEAKKEGR
jgi:predicted transcriptional regulator